MATFTAIPVVWFMIESNDYHQHRALVKYLSQVGIIPQTPVRDLSDSYQVAFSPSKAEEVYKWLKNQGYKEETLDAEPIQGG